MANPVRECTNSASAIEISSSPSRSASLTRVDPVGAGGEDEQGADPVVVRVGPEDEGVGDLSHVDPERVGGGAGGADGVGRT